MKVSAKPNSVTYQVSQRIMGHGHAINDPVQEQQPDIILFKPDDPVQEEQPDIILVKSLMFTLIDKQVRLSFICNILYTRL